MPIFRSSYANELWEKDKHHFLHPWQHFDSFQKEGALIIDRGEGPYVFDIEGKRYLDGIGGLWCVNIGYGRDDMVNAIANQAKRLPFFSAFVDTTNPPAAELASKLASLTPGSLNHVSFSSSGSAANDTAVRLAHYYQSRRGRPEKRHIISRKDAYHGSTYLGMSLGGKMGDRSPYFHYIDDFIHHVSSPNGYRRPEGMTVDGFCDALVEEFEQKILEVGGDKVAAFIAEPIQGAGGVIVPPAGYHQRMWEICKRYDILYISDEVVTAFGRLGHMFATKAVFDIQPDIIVTAKGITSGYVPLGATLFSDEIFEVISAPDPDAFFTHGFTYAGHPVACVAALENIAIIEREKICEHVREVGPYFEEQLQTLCDLPLVGDVRGRAFMMCIEYVADKRTKALLPDEANISKRVSDACEARGLIVRPVAHLNVMSPPLIVTPAQVDDMVEILRESVGNAAGDLKKAGFLD
ncbi:MAG: aminotransferase [Gammaproteobacteria bacterium]|jgi:adenosylmethionine-8-amino-7-oxononanoate aminotransferase|nr:aminotransferase [Gammaproteobacteria bacterium]